MRDIRKNILCPSQRETCMISYGDALGVMKKANLERHCISKNAKLNELRMQMRQDKISAPQQSFESQQATFTGPRDNEKIIHARHAVSYAQPANCTETEASCGRRLCERVHSYYCIAVRARKI